MSTSALAGYKAIARSSTAAGGAKVKIAELRNYRIKVAMNEIDATSHDSSGAREIIAGVEQWEASVEYCQVMSTAAATLSGQTIVDTLLTPTKVDFEFYPTGSSSEGGYNGSGYFTDWELAAGQDGAVMTNITLKGTGLLVRSSSQ